MKAKEKKFEDIKIGDSASFSRIITDKDLINFSDVSGDYNPLHLDEEYAVRTEFKGRVVYGMFMAALVSRLVGMELPGKRALLLKESLEFKKPARIGDRVRVEGKVAHKSTGTRILELLIKIIRGKEILTAGTVHVRVLK